jgi:hypothetical protein
MSSIFQDERSAVMTRHARRLSIFALAVIAIGVLLGLGAVELYETASRWVLMA